MASLTLHRVFVYGTLKRGEPNHHVMTNTENGTAKFVGEGKTTESWPLVIASKYNIPFLLHCKGKGQLVIGEVYDVDDEKMKELDLLEEYPKFYNRIKIPVYILKDKDDDFGNDTDVLCWVYILEKFKPHLLELPFLSNYSSKGEHGLEFCIDATHPESADPMINLKNEIKEMA
ncbi:gamma-glutamylaminecyclotransferase-like isoform X2 [Lingula anatina]|uniref:Gamma-glutamylcyclotransferase family protein n=1 Tax=Lingula anatina TaxID=7574 RepID=A0A1S3ICX3_LINAN|nr:gamma-glutamylaminecyclotransferase-like isoform X2 [Lingula anatina]|eukprot:XP_013395289.1 gamma-glutamylaminecyclotransferase-like isoform X2 [Lingula anatina]